MLDAGGYKVSLYKFGDNYIVMFEDPGAPEDQRGSTSEMIGFEVELNSECTSSVISPGSMAGA